MTLNAGDIRQTQRWRRLSRAKLLETPLCQDCAERGISAAAVEVDHIKNWRDHPELAFDWDNIRSLCRRCHAQKTRAIDDPRGKGRLRGARIDGTRTDPNHPWNKK
jgi:5-methylcytosine-specific restriction enzyme A